MEAVTCGIDNKVNLYRIKEAWVLDVLNLCCCCNRPCLELSLCCFAQAFCSWESLFSTWKETIEFKRDKHDNQGFLCVAALLRSLKFCPFDLLIQFSAPRGNMFTGLSSL